MADDITVAAPKHPLTWDATGPSLTALDGLLAELAAAAPAAAAPLAARADAAKAAARVPTSGRKLLRRAMRVLVGRMVDTVEERFNVIRTDLEAKAAAEAAAAGGGTAAAADGEHGGEHGGAAAEGSSSSVATTVGGSKAAKAAAKAAAAAAAKATAKGGKKGAAAAAGGAGAESETEGDHAAHSPGAGLPHVAHLQPAFHEKAVAGARTAIKVTLNGLGEEVLRHKVAVGDALEEAIRELDGRIAAEQERLLAAGGSSGGEWFSPPGPAGGVPAVGPGPAAPVRSAGLEALYWERLGLLRQWTGLGVPNRATIR
ncbi:hypothetical protein GPECTOR_16g608 [Gonium pectorale]|uniref:Uncharacterized protein n=1 Tax=Gonium pectorale TaxID=33097 RepID=A0A150GKW9_GONPE|nr:hypothetical protein GPECTOR_16g608 [Gonium pectorale]|eukprot:KXZ50434.1 hypothetical protein GPECTOR_16g608 [Gonium pectorale]